MKDLVEPVARLLQTQRYRPVDRPGIAVAPELEFQGRIILISEQAVPELAKNRSGYHQGSPPAGKKGRPGRPGAVLSFFNLPSAPAQPHSGHPRSNSPPPVLRLSQQPAGAE